MKTAAQTSTVPFTKEMMEEINRVRMKKLLTRNEFYKFSKINSKSAMNYWEQTWRISFKSLKKLQEVGIDLTELVPLEKGLKKN